MGAIALLERAVELGKINLAEDDPDVLRTAHQLGRTLLKDDDPTAARRVLEDAYGAGLWRLGDSDPLMLEISAEIGVAAEELGNRHEARKAFSRVAELGPGALGEGHPAVARARAYLGQDQGAPVRPEGAAQPQAALGPGGEESVTIPFQAGPPQAVQRAAGEEPATTPFPAVPPQAEPQPLEEPTTTLPTVAPTSAELVQPPNPASQQVWQPPAQPQPTYPYPQPPPPTYPQVPQPQPVQPQQPPAPQPQRQQPPAYLQPQPQTWHEQQPPWGEPQPWAQAGQPASTPPYEQKPQARRGLGLFAAVAAVLAAVIAVSALVFVLANRSGDKGDSNVPTLGGKPPTGVTLRDEGSRVRLTWKDPANGSVSFLVAMAQPGQQLKPVSTLGPGQTSYEINALNPSLNYCFAVVAVYRDNKFATSEQACTDRPTATK